MGPNIQIVLEPQTKTTKDLMQPTIYTNNLMGLLSTHKINKVLLYILLKTIAKRYF
jgi:hypothetical protein